MNRRKVETVVKNINYDWINFDFDHFLEHIVGEQDRCIIPIEMPNLAFSGYCVSVKQHICDYIFVNADDHPVSTLHNKIHELAHFLLDHLDSVIVINSQDELINLMMRFSRLRSYENLHPELLAEEREAEYFAYLIEHNVSKAKRLHELTLDEDAYDWGVPPFYGRFAQNEKRDNSS